MVSRNFAFCFLVLRVVLSADIPFPSWTSVRYVLEPQSAIADWQVTATELSASGVDQSEITIHGEDGSLRLTQT